MSKRTARKPEKWNAAFAAKLEAMGFRPSWEPVEGSMAGRAVIRGGMANVLRFVDATKKTLPEARNNPGIGAHIHQAGDVSFKGGTPESLRRDLEGAISMDRFNAARAKLAKNGLLQKLQTRVAEVVPKRKRFNSEHDGEWSYDRRWEITPFQATCKAAAPAPVIEINCDFSISCHATASAIDAYGALVWAISDILENAGLRTRIIQHEAGTRVRASDGYGSKGLESLIELELKSPEQYVAPSLLAAAFQSNFFRRPIFSLITACAELGDAAVAYGLGSCVQRSPAVKFADGVLYLSPDVRDGHTPEIEKAILEAIGVPV
jgi:hypothetical protein